MRKRWSPTIPGTDIDRLSFLLTLMRIHHDTTVDSLFKPNIIVEIANYGVLNMAQIAKVVRCGKYRVRRVAKVAQISLPNTRGFLEPGGLDAMYVVCQQLALGKRPSPKLLEELTPFVSAILMEKLTGVPEITYHRARKRMGART